MKGDLVFIVILIFKRLMRTQVKILGRKMLHLG